MTLGASQPTHRHHYHAINKGCRSAVCDRRVGRRWWLNHRPPEPVWAIPAAIVICESKGTNESPNEAGAAGYYQITEWEAKGGSPPDDASQHSKAEQGVVARRLYREQGTGPWVSSESCWGGRL